MAAVTGGAVAPPADLMRRIRVLQTRQRIEDVARRLLYDAEGAGAATTRFHANVKTRLLLLCTGTADEWPVRYRIADRTAAVYSATSDVLHSRRTYVDVPEALLREWEDVVRELDTLATQIRGNRR